MQLRSPESLHLFQPLDGIQGSAKHPYERVFLEVYLLPSLSYSHLYAALWLLCQLPERENWVLEIAKLIAACVCFAMV